MAIQIAAENVIGRDDLIENIWRRLAKKSLRFTAERRIGKTTVMQKMAAEPPKGMEVLYLDLEGIDSPDRFTEILLNRMRPLLSTKDVAKGWFDKLVETVGGTEIGGVVKLPDRGKMHWQTTLEKAVEGLCRHQSEKTIVLMFDEVPYMLQKIAVICDQGQQGLSLTLLDTLRSMRQQHNNLRMIFAGSVGLHHVVTELKQAQLASEPVNDMPAVEIHALSRPDAKQLARRLLNDEKVSFAEEETEAILEQLTLQTDGVPFYIEAVITRLGEMSCRITSATVVEIVQQQLTSDHDPWEMEHFRSRLSIYYRGFIADTSDGKIPNQEIAREILDHLSSTDEAQSIEQVWSAVNSKFAITDRQHIVQMLKSLALDHYLTSDTNKRYSFRFPLIRNWWATAQGIQE
jgi:hypothetical protein